MKYLVPSILLLVLCTGCSSDGSTSTSNATRLLNSLNIPEHVRELDSLSVFPPDTKPLFTIRFEEEQRFGEIYPTLLAPTVGFGPTTAVDLSGKVYLADRGKRAIQVYSPDGSLLTTIGRKGRGPGEFDHISAIGIHRNRLIAYDANLMRIQVYSLNPVRLTKTIVLDSQPWNKFDEVNNSRPATVLGLGNSTFLAGVLLNDRDGRSYFGYYTLDWDGNTISDKIVEQQRLLMHQGSLNNGATTTLRLPFTSEGVVAVAAGGTIYHANTREFLIRIYNHSGEYQRAIYYLYKQLPLEEDEAMDQFHPNLHSALKNADFPDTWPALESMFVDDEGRIWVSTITDNKETYEWWVLERSGKLLTRFTWPREESIQVVRNGKMYISRADEETGAQQVVRYGFEMEHWEAPASPPASSQGLQRQLL